MARQDLEPHWRRDRHKSPRYPALQPFEPTAKNGPVVYQRRRRQSHWGDGSLKAMRQLMDAMAEAISVAMTVQQPLKN